VGVVREIRDDRVAVEIGGVRVQIPWDDVESVPGGGDSTPTTGQVRSSAGWDNAGLVARKEVDLRGLRVDEATLQLERALDAAVVGNLSEIKIVHGFGTGAVRARTCEVLGADRRVESFRVGVQGEGGAGVTIAMLR
jgi:DNA mismatch repair protein MutS2